MADELVDHGKTSDERPHAGNWKSGKKAGLAAP